MIDLVPEAPSRLGQLVRLLLGRVDERLSYRRLVAFMVATWLFREGRLDEESWFWIAALFVGSEGAQRLLSTRRPTARGAPPES